MKTIGLGIGILLLVIVVFSPITSFGDMKAQNPRVTEKDFYNMIAIDIVISKPDIEVNDVIYVAIIDFTLDNENGKKYYPNHECGPQLFYQMTGKTGPNGSFTVCYDVEKNFNNFKMYYKKELFGNLDLNELNRINQQIKDDAGLRPMDDGHSCPSLKGYSPRILVNGQCVPDPRYSSVSQNDNTGKKIQESDVIKSTNPQITCGQGTELVDGICQIIRTGDKLQVFDKPIKESEQKSISNVGDVFSRLIEMFRSLFHFS